MEPDETQRHERFLRLYLRHEESLRGYVRTLLPMPGDAGEVLQNVAAVLWRKFDELSSPLEFRRWSFGVARLEVLQYRRSRARDRHVFDERVLELLASAVESEADRLAAEREALQGCLQKLTESQRALVAAAYAAGERIDEYAARSGRTAMSVYKALHRIRMQLLECVGRVLSEGAGE